MTLTLIRPKITAKPGARLHENLDTPQLIELAVKHREGHCQTNGASVVIVGNAR